MEKLINKSMWKHLENHKLISDRQFGFRAGRSTSDALTYIAQRLSNTINDREEARVVCLDISKAFERVWHPGLLVKLRALGFAGKFAPLVGRLLKKPLNEGHLKWQIFHHQVHQCRCSPRVNSWTPPIHHFHRWHNFGYIKHLQPVCWRCHTHEFHQIQRGENTCCCILKPGLVQHWEVGYLLECPLWSCTISNRQDAKDSHPCLQFFGTTLTETETVELLGLTLSKDLSWKHDVTSMAKSAAQRTGLLRIVAPYLLPTQRAMIYKAIIRSKMEYASSAWFGTTPTSLSQLDAVQRRAIRIIDLPEDDLISHQIQPLGTRREVGALTLFHRMYYGEAPELLCQLLPEHLQLDPRLRRSVRSHDLAVQIPRSNLVSHKRSFVPSAAHIWNSLPEYIPSLEKRACFKKEVNRYLGDN